MFFLFRHRPHVYIKEVKYLSTLALPMLLAQLAQTGTGFIDTVMAGGAGVDDLAAVALGNSLFITLYVTLMGVMTALNPILSQAFGAGETHKIGEIGRQGLYLGAVLGLFGLILMWAMIPTFKAQFNLNAYTLDITGDYIFYVAFAMPAAMIHRALHAYALSLNRPSPITLISWLCFFLNIPLNYVFVYGEFGLPKLGGAGCGLATAIVFWVNALLLGLYIKKDRYFHPFGLFNKKSLPNLETQKQFLTLGVPIGLSFFIEVSLFTCIMFLVAKLDGNTENYLSAQQIVINLTSLIFMIPQSVGVASTTRVGYFLGKRNPVKARYNAGVAISFAVGLSVLTAMFLIAFKTSLASLYTDSAVVISIAASLIVFAAAFQLVDAVQCVASYALRGYKLAKLPMLIHAVAFWGCGLLPGYYLAFYQGMGIYGFWWGLVGSLAVAAVFLLWYLHYHSKKVITSRAY
ncbi:MAG: MATE family efflux transporter [Moraxella sp.]|nr:MATE family efflux transporter [Moraxella sp.]